ncbi:heme-binding protein 2-like [Pelobates fuscus]|uniref:heme-binding protein 2-like n=1 Tax=Pelobates fuscus TaxID=191477 RepID=UPI002FE44083
MYTNVLIVLCLLCLHASVVFSDDYQPPEFCRDSQCPRYQVVETSDDFELRAYDATRWALTNTDPSMDSTPITESFKLMAHYIRGSNNKGMKMEMTVPVTVFIPLNSESPINASLAFFLPPELDIPEPTDPNIFFLTFPETKLYVKSFDGFAEPIDFFEKAKSLYETLVAQKKEFLSSFYACNIYDSPYEVVDRHNEVYYVAI